MDMMEVMRQRHINMIVLCQTYEKQAKKLQEEFAREGIAVVIKDNNNGMTKDVYVKEEDKAKAIKGYKNYFEKNKDKQHKPFLTPAQAIFLQMHKGGPEL